MDHNQPTSQVRVVQYLRMSTEHQRYSLENQAATIAIYAASRGLSVVRTYRDAGKSGLTLKDRPGLQQLLSDTLLEGRDFSQILVLDVSRWGRFQDTDQSAHYEFICRQAGVEVQYCEEGFENDGSIGAVLLKSIKRVMAAEYSRELSKKVAIGKRSVARRGFWPGGPAGYGFRRRVISQSGREVGLAFGEHKAWQAANSELVWGPPEEIAVVRKIYRWYLHDGCRLVAITRRLNDDGIRSENGTEWTPAQIKFILRSEKYCGRMVFNRQRAILGAGCIKRPSSEWQIYRAKFRPIISRALFLAVQSEFLARRSPPTRAELVIQMKRLHAQFGRVTHENIAGSRYGYGRYVKEFGSWLGAISAADCSLNAQQEGSSQHINTQSLADEHRRALKEQILGGLRTLLMEEGRLSMRLIDADKRLPTSTVCANRFGGLAPMYEAVGYRRWDN